MIITRDAWQAAYGRGHLMPDPTPKALVVIHHAGTPDVLCGVGRSREAEHVRAIERYHVQTRGWAGVGYSWLAFQSGNVYEGRGWGRVGAHTAGRNSSAYGICLVIDGMAHGPTEAAVEAILELIGLGITAGVVDPGYRVAGHRAFAATACPGHMVAASLGRLGPVWT